MTKTVHIFFNGEEADAIPEGCPWEQFERHDAVRSFLQTCESWKSAGWNVRRFSTAKSEPIEFTGRVKESTKWYPESRWRFCRDADIMLRREGAGPFGFHWFATMDSFNRCFTPHMADAAEMQFGEKGCINLQADHFSMSTIAVTWPWLREATWLIHQYDTGQLPAINSDYVSDETILRHYADYLTLPAQHFPISVPDACIPELVHFARSTLKRAYCAIPSNENRAE